MPGTLKSVPALGDHLLQIPLPEGIWNIAGENLDYVWSSIAALVNGAQQRG
jgi:hypothetical protein